MVGHDPAPQRPGPTPLEHLKLVVTCPTCGHSDAKFNLSRREVQIIELLLEGLDSKDIGARLGISTQTVKNRMSLILRKTGTSNRVRLVSMILRASN